MQVARPSTSPHPVTTPSAGASTPSIARWAKCGRPWMPISTKVPSSTRRSIRSRAVSLPRSCCSAIFASARRSCSCAVRSASGAVPGSRLGDFSSVAISVSASFPLRVAFLEEGGDALDDVLGREGEGELGAQELERVVERHVLLAVHRVVAEPHQHRALGGEFRRPLAYGGVELSRRDDLV